MPYTIFTVLYYIIIYYTTPYDTILYYTILYYTILYYTILYYTILYYTILYYTILYYTILYYTVLASFVDELIHSNRIHFYLIFRFSPLLLSSPFVSFTARSASFSHIQIILLAAFTIFYTALFNHSGPHRTYRLTALADTSNLQIILLLLVLILMRTNNISVSTNLPGNTLYQTRTTFLSERIFGTYLRLSCKSYECSFYECSSMFRFVLVF